jgi:hypothetical protein
MGMRMTPAALSAATKGDLENFMVAATPGGIERQEADEQRKAVAVQRLPINGTISAKYDGKDTPRALWENLGFVFGEKHDDIFVNVTFPAGWKLKPTDHSMWSDLLDDKGRKRAAMFYKGAFYDRSAHIYMVTRFSHEADYTVADYPRPVHVTDCGKGIHVVGSAANYSDGDRLGEVAKAWLTEKYPQWEDPTAYWD